jgi:hypothetical protein
VQFTVDLGAPGWLDTQAGTPPALSPNAGEVAKLIAASVGDEGIPAFVISCQTPVVAPDRLFRSRGLAQAQERHDSPSALDILRGLDLPHDDRDIPRDRDTPDLLDDQEKHSRLS